METNFKVLTHNGVYVDENLLNKGIYEVTKPFLYDYDSTIESIISHIKHVNESYDLRINTSNYIENIKKCTLTDVQLTVKSKIDFEEIKKRLDESLSLETSESLNEFLNEQRNSTPTYLTIEEVSQKYGETLHCKWLSPDGNEWLDKFMLVNGTFIKEMENNCIKYCYEDKFYNPKF
jgi:hypothetical protein